MVERQTTINEYKYKSHMINLDENAYNILLKTKNQFSHEGLKASFSSCIRHLEQTHNTERRSKINGDK